MDNLVFEESVNAEVTESEFISKKWLYVNDNNSQNYSSQIILDTTPLSNSGGYIDWQEAYMVMPLVVQLSSATAGNLPAPSGAGTDVADWSWAFKSGFWHMINSMTVEFNNQNIVQQTPFLNVFRSFKAQTTFSKDDVDNHGASLGFAMDTADSWSYNILSAANTLLSANGRGLCNNRNGNQRVATADTAGGAPAISLVNTTAAGVLDGAANKNLGNASPAGAYSGEDAYNEGFFERCRQVNRDPDSLASGAAPTGATATTGQSFILSNSGAATAYISGKQPNQTAGAVSWNVFAKLRLKDLSDYFTKVPLLKGATMRFYINTNQAIVNFTTTAGVIDNTGVTTKPTLVVNSTSILGGLTCPLMVASADYGQGSNPLVAGTYALSVSIYQNNNTGVGQTRVNTPLTAVRLYAPVYKFNPLAEQRYLSLSPQKRVEYNDIFQYQFSAIGAGSSFNFLVTNGIQNIQSVLVVPLISQNQNGLTTASDAGGTIAAGGALSTLLSATCPTGSMPDPISLINFNILVSGVNLFLNNQLYDYEQFRQELMSSNQLNGNITSGLTSGLISERMFSNAYRWYYGNAARCLPSEEGVSRSIQLIGQNNSLVIIDLLVFVEFKKSMTIDISTGARIE